jgi:hypothetical protein
MDRPRSATRSSRPLAGGADGDCLAGQHPTVGPSPGSLRAVVTTLTTFSTPSAASCSRCLSVGSREVCRKKAVRNGCTCSTIGSASCQQPEIVLAGGTIAGVDTNAAHPFAHPAKQGAADCSQGQVQAAEGPRGDQARHRGEEGGPHVGGYFEAHAEPRTATGRDGLRDTTQRCDRERDRGDEEEQVDQAGEIRRVLDQDCRDQDTGALATHGCGRGHEAVSPGRRAGSVSIRAAETDAASSPVAIPCTTRAAYSQPTPLARAKRTRLTASSPSASTTTGLRPIASDRSPKTSKEASRANAYTPKTTVVVAAE